MLLAVLLHLEGGLAVGLYFYFFAPRNIDLAATGGASGEASDTLDVEMLDEGAARKLIAELEKQEERQREAEIKKEQEAPRPTGQVVELARPRRQERPDEARFVAEHDSKVERETRKHGELNQKAVQGRSDGPDEVTTPPTPAQTAAQPPGAPSRVLAMRAPPASRVAAVQPPGLGPREPSGASPEQEPGPPAGDGNELSAGRLARAAGVTPPRPPGGAAGGAPIPGLMPTPEQVARAIGSGTSDHLQGIEEGEETALNAKKWKFASFFNRVKQQVRDHWRPAEEYRKRDPTFRIYGQKDRYTLLRVQLKPDGTLANIVLESPSGVEFLDDEAIEAFKQAQPFPNPPHGLVEDGLISFRFGFFFEIGGGGVPRMKYFRYNDF